MKCANINPDDVIIHAIEKVRGKNNKNWMDLVRLAFKHAPDEAREIFKKISACDKEINNLTEILGDR